MSHVDEGALHAYLDGALEEYPTGETRRIRAHLERCEHCARALAEARRLRDEAELVLAVPELDVSAPPLEELRRMAQSSPERAAPKRHRSLYRLGWAASVLLALGVGWMVRGGAPGPSGSSVADLAPASREAPAAEAGEVAGARQAERQAAPESSVASVQTGAAADEGPAGSETEVAASPTESRVAEALPAPPPASEPPEVDVTSVEMTYADPVTEAGAVLEELAPAPDVAPLAESTEAVGRTAADQELQRTADAGVTDTVREDAPARAAAATDARMSLASRATAAGPLAQARGLPETDDAEIDRRAEDEEAEPGSLVVPGLEVISIVWREEGVVPAGVRVLQRTRTGEVLELIHLPAGFDPASVEAAEPGVRELVVPRDQGWLIMRAPLEEEELRTLLAQMDDPGPR